MQDLPTVIEKEIRQRKKEEFYDIYLHGDNLYVVVGLGQKNKAGYQVEVQEIKGENTGLWRVLVKKQEPKKNQVVAQVINYPMSITKIWARKVKEIPSKIIFEDKNGESITTSNIREISQV